MIDPYAKPTPPPSPILQGSNPETWVDPVSGLELAAVTRRNALEVDEDAIADIAVIAPPRFDTIRLVGPAVTPSRWPEAVQEWTSGDMPQDVASLLPGASDDMPNEATVRATASTVTIAWEDWAWARVYLDPFQGKPRLELQLHPAALWAHADPAVAYRQAAEPLIRWLSWAFGPRAIEWGMDALYAGWHVTRCDVACDVTGWEIREELRHCMVGSRRRSIHESAELAMHGGRVAESIYFSGHKSALGLVCYDKTRQITAKKREDDSTYAPVWSDNGWRRGQRVTRWEFRATTDALRFYDEFGVLVDLTDPLALAEPGKLGLAWSTWTASRRVVLPTRSRTSSCPVHPWWRTLQLAGGLPPVRRTRPREDMAEEGLQRRRALDAQRLALTVHRTAARVGLEVRDEADGEQIAVDLWREGHAHLDRERTMKMRARTWSNEKRLVPKAVLKPAQRNAAERWEGLPPMKWGRAREVCWLRADTPVAVRELRRIRTGPVDDDGDAISAWAV